MRYTHIGSSGDRKTTADRWPRFVDAVTGTTSGEPVFRAVHAVPLRLRRQAIGAMNLFDRQPGAMRAADLALGQAFADVATIAILQERAIRRAEVLSEQPQGALTSRVIIEQAKGVLAHHTGLSMDQAFNQLRGHARGTNQRLSEVARAIADRTLDPRAVRPANPRRS